MPLDIVVGTQWGDEGKGRVVDLLSVNADFVARYNGGDNAGHTVTVGDQTFKLHLIPSGIIHPQPSGTGPWTALRRPPEVEERSALPYGVLGRPIPARHHAAVYAYPQC
ncbi:MAG: adenylosuccinate synthetase [Anaerolineales bacterium]